MGILSRLVNILKTQINAYVNETEDPYVLLDYSLQKQITLLRTIKQVEVNINTSQNRLLSQAAQIKKHIQKLFNQAKEAVNNGNEKHAITALEQKFLAIECIKRIEKLIKSLDKKKSELAAEKTKLIAKIENFNARRELILSGLDPHDRKIRARETSDKVSIDVNTITLNITQIEESMEKLFSHFNVIEDFIESDNFQYSIESEFQRITIKDLVQEQLKILKRETTTK